MCIAESQLYKKWVLSVVLSLWKLSDFLFRTAKTLSLNMCAYDYEPIDITKIINIFRKLKRITLFLGYYRIKNEDKPFDLSSLVAGARLELTTFGLWAQRATTAPSRDLHCKITTSFSFSQVFLQFFMLKNIFLMILPLKAVIFALFCGAFKGFISWYNISVFKKWE